MQSNLHLIQLIKCNDLKATLFAQENKYKNNTLIKNKETKRRRLRCRKQFCFLVVDWTNHAEVERK